MINRNYIIRHKDDNSFGSESIYFEACENSFELNEFKKVEEEYKKKIKNISNNQNTFNLNNTIQNETNFTTNKENQITFKHNKILNNSNFQNENKSFYEDCAEENNNSLNDNNENIFQNKKEKITKEFQLNESNSSNFHSENSKNEEISTSKKKITKNKAFSLKLDNNILINSPYGGRIDFKQENPNSNNISINSLKINSIIFEKIKDSDINLKFLQSKLRTIPVKIKNISNTKNRHFKNLIELQNFYIDDSPIWVIKFSYDSKFLASGGKKGIVKIFEIMNYEYEHFKSSYDKNQIISYLNFLSEKPKKILNEHTSDIIDLSWSSINVSYLLSASLDYSVILWNISEKQSFIKKFIHNDMLTCVSFYPFDDNIFISGCLDRFVRLWKIMSDKKPEYFNIEEKITSLSYFPSGENVAIGTHNGKIIIYDIKPKISYNCSFVVRNRVGKNSLGKKVTNIEFVNRNSALITTCDSRIRYVSMPDGKMIYKYKGLVNEKSMIRAHCDLNYDLIISGSENGYCYIWSRNNKEDKNKKNYHYEYFKPYSKDIVECSMFVNENCMTGYLKKFYKLTTNVFVSSIIVNATDKGRIQILLNVDDSQK